MATERDVCFVPSVGDVFCLTGTYVRVVDKTGQFLIVERLGKPDQVMDVHRDFWNALGWHFTLPSELPERMAKAAQR